MIIQLLKSNIDLTESKVQIHYANTEVNTQEIRLDPLLLMNFYTNEDRNIASKTGMSFMEQLCKNKMCAKVKIDLCYNLLL